MEPIEQTNVETESSVLSEGLEISSAEEIPNDFASTANSENLVQAETAELPKEHPTDAVESMNQREERLQQMEQRIIQQQLEMDAKKVLRDNHLPEKFVTHLARKDLESTTKAIVDLKNVFDEAVQQQVELRFRGKTPERGNGSLSMSSSYSLEQKVRDSLQ